MRTKKVKPPPMRFEYTLTISKDRNNVLKKDFILFRFQTTKEFLTEYILEINTQTKDNNIYFDIIGFSVSVGELSKSGFAEFEYRLYEFKNGDYNIIIKRMGQDKTRFKLKIKSSDKEQLKVTNISKKTFIEITLKK